jgi:hypothetical protein
MYVIKRRSSMVLGFRVLYGFRVLTPKAKKVGSRVSKFWVGYPKLGRVSIVLQGKF